MAACVRGDESLVRLVVSKGCDVSAREGVFYYVIYFNSVVLIVFCYRMGEQLCTMLQLMVTEELQRI